MIKKKNKQWQKMEQIKKKVITLIWKKIFFQKGKNDATHFLSIKYGRIKLVKERIKSTRVNVTNL